MTPPIIGLTLNYRDASRTSRCVNAMLEDGAMAMLVWDNSADDGISSSELRSISGNDPRVQIVVSNSNLGFAAAVNRSISLIRAKWPDAWVMLINNDAVLVRGALKRLHNALQQKTNAVIAYPRIEHKGKVVGTIYYQRYFGILSFDRPLPGSHPYPSGCAMLIAPERASSALFDEDFFMYGEDMLLGYRLGPKKMIFVPEVLVKHESSATSNPGSVFYETQLACAHWLLAKKMARSRLEYWCMISGRALSLGLRALVRSARYRNVVPLCALSRGWRLAKKRA